MVAYYEICFALSVVFLCTYFLRMNRTHDANLGFLFVLIAVSELGALMRMTANTVESAVLGNKISYIGACFLQLVITFTVFSLCRMRVPRLLGGTMLFIGMGIYGMILTNERTWFYYKSVDIVKMNGVTVLLKEYGPGHALFYAMIMAFTALNVGILIYGIIKKKDASVKNLQLVLGLELVNVMFYFIQKFTSKAIDITCLSFVVTAFGVLLLMDRLALYNIDNSVTDALLKSGELGCFSFALNRNYLGSNAVAKKWLPPLGELRVDTPIPEDTGEKFYQRIDQWMNAIDESKDTMSFYYIQDGVKYKFVGGYMMDGTRKRGYQFTVSDYSREQKYTDLMQNFASELEKEVKEKTEHLEEMHDRMVLGMAEMVEGRDYFTGGHIKRTSELVRILVNAMREDPECTLTDDFCAAVVKAAPMHDLGKITVDDAILKKPGRFTPEEFEQMKSHAKAGAGIVSKILCAHDEDEVYFAQIAENVAHYHHERMDGSGYPEGLAGKDIPIEARIMAIADVYDALISKRCYKDSMSFEQADAIMMEGMGSQFDPGLQKVYEKCRPLFEKYYSEVAV